MKLFFTLLLFLSFSNLSIAQNGIGIELKNLEGEYFSIASINDKPIILIDFWSTHCKPCLKAIPSLIKINEHYQDSLTIIGINEDSPRNMAKVKPFAHTLGISYPVLLDTEQDIMTALQVTAMPTLIIMNTNGKILYRHEGFVLGDDVEIEAKLKELLADVQ